MELRNFVGNANKFAKNNIYISIKSDSEISPKYQLKMMAQVFQKIY